MCDNVHISGNIKTILASHWLKSLQCTSWPNSVWNSYGICYVRLCSVHCLAKLKAHLVTILWITWELYEDYAKASCLKLVFRMEIAAWTAVLSTSLSECHMLASLAACLWARQWRQLKTGCEHKYHQRKCNRRGKRAKSDTNWVSSREQAAL